MGARAGRSDRGAEDDHGGCVWRETWGERGQPVEGAVNHGEKFTFYSGGKGYLWRRNLDLLFEDELSWQVWTWAFGAAGGPGTQHWGPGGITRPTDTGPGLGGPFGPLIPCLCDHKSTHFHVAQGALSALVEVTLQ